ncbi:hypothetical protein B4U84_13555, partial [Westiellopsis prolifica IICB1]
MLKRLWQYFKRFIQRLFLRRRTVSVVSEETKPAPQRTDAEYESLFLQLLEGVNEGWSRGNVRGFLDGRKISEAGLVGWLRGFGEGLLASDTVHDELARRMVLLGGLDVGVLGEVAREIGMELLGRGGEMNRRGAEDAEEEGGEAEVWLNRGVEQLEAGDFEGAIASWDEAVKIKPDFDLVWTIRGIALRQLGRYEEAIAS